MLFTFPIVFSFLSCSSVLCTIRELLFDLFLYLRRIDSFQRINWNSNPNPNPNNRHLHFTNNTTNKARLGKNGKLLHYAKPFKRNIYWHSIIHVHVRRKIIARENGCPDCVKQKKKTYNAIKRFHCLFKAINLVPYFSAKKK